MKAAAPRDISCATPEALPARPREDTPASSGAGPWPTRYSSPARTIGQLLAIDSQPGPKCLARPRGPRRAAGQAALAARRSEHGQTTRGGGAPAVDGDGVSVPEPSKRLSWLAADDGAADCLDRAVSTLAERVNARYIAEQRAAGKRVAQRKEQAGRLAAEVHAALIEDESRLALRPADDEALSLSCLQLVNLLQGHVNRSTAANDVSNWRHWMAFCASMNTSLWRDDAMHRQRRRRGPRARD